MGKAWRRWRRRIGVGVALLLALAGAGFLALPHVVEALVDRAAREAGFPAASVSGVRPVAFGIAIARLDLAPTDETDDRTALRLEEIVVDLALESIWQGRAEAIRIGSVVVEAAMQGASIAIPGRSATEPATGEKARDADGADAIGPQALPFERLEIERARFVLKRPEGTTRLLVEQLRARRSDGDLSAAATYHLAPPSATLSGTVDVVWQDPEAPLIAKLTVEEGAARGTDWLVEALSGKGRLLWSSDGTPEASFSLEANRTRLYGVPLGALALAGEWQGDRGALRLKSRADDDAVALRLQVEVAAGEQGQEGSGAVQIEGSGRFQIEDLGVIAGTEASGHASLELDLEGAWPAPDRDARGERVVASGRFRLQGGELALPGIAREGRLSIEGTIDATPRRVELAATAPWTARATPVEDALPAAAVAFEGERLELTFEPDGPLVVSGGTSGSGTHELRLVGRLRAESTNGAALSFVARETLLAQGPAGRVTAEIGSLSLSAEAIPLAGLALGVQAYQGRLRFESGRARLVGQGRLLFEGGASGVVLDGGRLDWSGAVVADATQLELRPDRCLALEVSAARRAGLRIEDARLACIETHDDGPLLSYRFEDALLALGLAVRSTPLSLAIFEKQGSVAEVQGEWPESELSLQLRGGVLSTGKAQTQGGRVHVSPMGLELIDFEGDATLARGASSEAKLEVRKVLSTRAPPLWTPLQLDVDASQTARADPLRFEAILSDALGTFILEISGEQREAGVGEAAWTLHPVRFIPDATEIADLSPWMAIWVRELTGRVAFEGSTQWGAAGLQSQGLLSLDDLALSLNETSISGLDSQIDLASLWPLRTAGRQRIEIALIDAGVPLTDGEILFQLQPGPALVVHELRFQMVGGQIMAEPFRVGLSAPLPLRVALRAQQVELSQIFEVSGIGGLRGQGRLSGEIPLVLSPEGLRLEGGRLDTRGDGQLRYTPEEMPAFLRGDGLRRRMLREALQDYRYETLALSVSGEIAGEQKVRLTARGRNPSFLDGHPVELDVSIDGPLASVLRNMARPYRARGVSKPSGEEQ